MFLHENRVLPSLRAVMPIKNGMPLFFLLPPNQPLHPFASLFLQQGLIEVQPSIHPSILMFKDNQGYDAGLINHLKLPNI